MNLLTDPWVPVREAGRPKLTTLRQILCEEGGWQLSLARDDMELAALQLLVCLTQVCFLPDDAKQLRSRAEKPLARPEYEAGIADLADWFELEHPKHPFMQTVGVQAKEITPIQKLFVGLPEGNNHAFFNGVGEVRQVSPAMAAIALFNQANNCPGFGGGFKDGLRGGIKNGAPVTTLVRGNTLRESIWFNVLSRNWVARVLPSSKRAINEPTWVAPIKAKCRADEIGMLRGLFWQPSRLILLTPTGPGPCDVTGLPSASLYQTLDKEQFRFDVSGTWPHPHSPRQWQLKDGTRTERFLSFAKTAPTWTQLTDFLLRGQAREEGHEPAPVISQFQEVFARTRRLQMIVGGYRNKISAIIGRRHELLSLSDGWDDSLDALRDFIDLALHVKTVLRKKLYGFGKRVQLLGVADLAEERFYRISEAEIHSRLRSMAWREAATQLNEFGTGLATLARMVFDEVTAPYQHEPKMIAALATARKTLNSELNKILKGE